MNQPAFLFAVVLATAAVTACHSGEPARSSATLSSATPVSYADFVGTWHFVYTDGRRAAVEADLAAKITDAAALATAKKEAAEEAATSEIELTSDARFLSRIDGKEILASPVVAKATDDGHALDLTSPTHGVTMRVELRDASTLVMHDPRKGELVFRR